MTISFDQLRAARSNNRKMAIRKTAPSAVSVQFQCSFSAVSVQFNKKPSPLSDNKS